MAKNNNIGLVSAQYSFKNFDSLLKEKFLKFNLYRLTEFIQNLYIYKNIFATIPHTDLAKNGFTDNHIRLFKPVLESKIIQAQTKKSDLLNAEQLAGQVALFGLGKHFDNARSNGTYRQENITYTRQPLINIANKLAGKDCNISFALNKIIKGYYAIIDSSLLQPSHIGNIQNPLHFIPEAQPRNRATSASGHNTPKLIAENLRPAEIVEGATAYAGAPIINQRGEVIQGNGRAYTIKYYYANFPNDPANYIKWIKENLTCLGFRTKIILPKQPVVVRMVNAIDNEAIELGQFTQKDLEAVANETTQIKSKVGLINDIALDTILNNLLAKDTSEQSLSELIRVSDILKVLVKETIIRGDDLEVYTRNGVINETGVNFITKLLLNLIFKDGDVNTPDVFLQLPVSLQKAIEKSALYILKCRGKQSINLEVAKAILGLRDYLIFKPNGSIKEWQQQTDIFNNTIANKYSPFEIKLISIFADNTSQKQIVDIFKNYAFWATLQPGNMFDDERPALSKKEAVLKVFGIELTETTNPKLKAISIAKAKALALNLINDNLQGVKKFPIKIGKIGKPLINNNQVPSGNIYLEKGNDLEGYQHIIKRHSNELQQLNLTAEMFAKWVLDNFTEIYLSKGKTRDAYLLVFDIKKPKILVCGFRKKQKKNYYTIITEGFKNRKELTKYKLLWSRAASPSALNGFGGVLSTILTA